MNKDTYIIAEVGQAHDGSLGILHSYIDVAAEVGADAVKFQTHIAEAESSELEQFRVNFSYEDKTRFDYWKRMEFTEEQWAGIKKHCDEVGIEFLSSPFSLKAVELLERIGVSKYKVGSGEVSNFLMLDKIAQTGKPIILSSGMSTFFELDETIEFLQSREAAITLLQCTTSYPTQPENIGLNVMVDMQSRYGLPVGLSDHSGTVYPSYAAVAKGASVLEAHIVFDKKMFGPDSKSSLDIEGFRELVEGVRFIDKMNNNPVEKNDSMVADRVKNMFQKSLAVNKSLDKGATIRLEDLESKKPGDAGILSKNFKSVVGKKLNKDKAQWAFLQEGDFDE